MTTLASHPFDELLSQVAAKTPTPGGGAVASATAALAAALAQMVVAYSVGKKSLAVHQAELERAAESLPLARHLLMQLADEDAQAYGLVNELTRPPEGEPPRTSGLPAALNASIQEPLAVIAACSHQPRRCERLAPITNTHLHSALAIAAVLADAAARASRWNVAVNAASLPDAAARDRALAEADRALSDSAARREAVEQACRH